MRAPPVGGNGGWLRVAGLAWLLLGGCEWVRLPDDDTVYDLDGDGWTSLHDCDDFNERVRPLAPEACNGTDNNCSGDESDARDAMLWYADLDGDGYGDPGNWVTDCDQPLGYVSAAFDCDDTDPAVFQGAPETDCSDPVDYNCDGLPAAWDNDGDGWVGCEDCDDASLSTFPGAAEACNGADDDCDGIVDNGDAPTRTWWQDADGDGWGGSAVSMEACDRPTGFSATDTDCDDADATRHPDAPEACDALDNDCDEVVDEPDRFGNDRWYVDADGDDYGDANSWEASCTPVPGRVDVGGDCDDADGAVNPDAAETCDGVDQDCDGAVDDDPLDPLPWYRDLDADGFGSPSFVTEACSAPAGYLDHAGDCADTDATINPDAPERCGGGDEDCDGRIDEDDATGGGPWYADGDGDGWGDDTDVSHTCVAADDRVASGGDCDDADVAYHPGALEIDCDDPADYNCDGSTGRADVDGDGWVACRDCDDADAETSPSAAETCDGTDEDCDGEADEDVPDADVWFPDVDGDGYGDPLRGVAACEPPEGHVADDGDCDDTDAARSPLRREVCTTTIDDDCDGDANHGAIDCALFYADSDGDSFGDGTACLCEAEAPYTAAVDGDCDDAEATIHPDAVEVCGDSVDNDCDGLAYGCGVAGERSLVDADEKVTGIAPEDLFGTALASSGDLDGDGHADLLVGAPGVDGGAADAGAVYLFRGPLATGTVAGAAEVWLGDAVEDGAGHALALGDLDGDGTPDLVVGAPYADPTGSAAGAVYVLLSPGPGGGLSSADARLLGTDESDYAGFALAVLADTDLDGDDELAVGAPRESAESAGAGAVYVFDDAPSGTSAVADADAVLLGRSPGDFFGRAVASAGDLDGDGLGDLAVGAYADDTRPSNGGAAYVYLGPVVGRVTTDAADAVRYGVRGGDYAGYALAAGDLDADGYDDLVVGAFANDDGGDEAGAAYLLRGPVTGTDTLVGDATLYGTVTNDNAGSSLAVGDLDDDGFADVAVTGQGAGYGYKGVVWVAYGPLAGVRDLVDAESATYGQDASDAAGRSLAIPGDHDGDGYFDLLIGAPEEDSAATDAGAVYVLGGGPGL